MERPSCAEELRGRGTTEAGGSAGCAHLHREEEVLDRRLLLHHLAAALLVERDRRAPRREAEQQPQLPRRELLERLLDRDEVLEALGHLQAVDAEVAAVQPVVAPLVVEALWRARACTHAPHALPQGRQRTQTSTIRDFSKYNVKCSHDA